MGTRQAVLQHPKPLPFVEAAAAGAARERLSGRVLKLKGAQGAADAVPDGMAFPVLAAPLKPNPESEHHRQKQGEVDEDEQRKADADPGSGTAGACGSGAER